MKKLLMSGIVGTEIRSKYGGEGRVIASLPGESDAVTAKSSLMMKDEGRRE